MAFVLRPYGAKNLLCGWRWRNFAGIVFPQAAFNPGENPTAISRDARTCTPHPTLARTTVEDRNCLQQLRRAAASGEQFSDEDIRIEKTRIKFLIQESSDIVGYYI
jgi:hypothetical protein